MQQSFKWYAGRSDVVNYKDIPQDPRSIVDWWRAINEIYGAGPADAGRGPRQREPYAASSRPARTIPEETPLVPFATAVAPRSREEIRRLGRKYRAGYLLSPRETVLPLPIAYENDGYCIYRLENEEAGIGD